MASPKRKKWIAVDLDGTLAHSESGHGIDTIGAPIEPMVERVKRWVAGGADVRIFTARAWSPQPRICGFRGPNVISACRTTDPRVSSLCPACVRIQQIEMIEIWCADNLGFILPITCEKDPSMGELWDDRAVAVERNTGDYKLWGET